MYFTPNMKYIFKEAVVIFVLLLLCLSHFLKRLFNCRKQNCVLSSDS